MTIYSERLDQLFPERKLPVAGIEIDPEPHLALCVF